MKKLLVITFLFAALGSFAQDSVDSIPDWFNNPPVSAKKFYGVGVGTSQSIDIAEKKAILSANLQIAEQVEPVKVQNIKTEKGKIRRETVNTTLRGVKMVKKASSQRGEIYTVYVMMEMKKKR